MKAADFLSTPDSLLADSIRYGNHLADNGWEVSIEPFDLAYPRTPVFTARRDHTTYVVEVQSSLELAVLEQWARFCKGCADDTRIVVCLASIDPPDGVSLSRLRAIGVGLVLISDGEPMELVPPIDLALRLELPELPEELRPTLGAAYDLIQKGEWREGFESACTRLEQAARAYLNERIVRAGVTFVSPKGTIKSYSEDAVGRMTLGRLATVFQEIRSPNVADSRLGQSLKTVNDNRITVAHFKGISPERERALRETVARNMFVVVNGLRYAHGLQ